MLWLFMTLAFAFNMASWLILVNKRKEGEGRGESAKAYTAIICAVVAIISFFWHIISPHHLAAKVNFASNTLAGCMFWWMLYSSRSAAHQQKTPTIEH